MEIIGYGACSVHKHHQLRIHVPNSIFALRWRPTYEMISGDRALSNGAPQMLWKSKIQRVRAGWRHIVKLAEIDRHLREKNWYRGKRSPNTSFLSVSWGLASGAKEFQTTSGLEPLWPKIREFGWEVVDFCSRSPPFSVGYGRNKVRPHFFVARNGKCGRF